MAKPIKHVTPEDRVGRWRKMFAAPRLLDAEETEAAFEEFTEAFVPSHIRKRFVKFFGVPRAVFGNRFFMEDAQYQNWDTRLSQLLSSASSHADAIVIYGAPDQLEAHALRGELRRSLRDIIIDDWQAACAIVRAGNVTIYFFIEPKMKGCMIRIVNAGGDLDGPTEADGPDLYIAE